MKLNIFGDIALDQWSKLPDRFPNIELGEFVVMPNHIHGIIILHDSLVRAGFTPAHSEAEITPAHSEAEITPAHSEAEITPARPGQPQGLPQQGQVGGLPQDGQAGGLPQQGQAGGLPEEGRAGGLPEEGQAGGLAEEGQAGGLAQQGQPQGLPQQGQPQGLPLLGDIVGAYKSLVANACLEIFKSKSMVMGKLWQRNYWEHIIRDEKSLQAITLYIQENPAQWKKDQSITGDRT